MNDIERITAFKQAKKLYVNFLATVLWQLADTRERFAQSMHCALFGLWRQVDKVQGPQAFKVLYRIALSANTLAWRSPIPTAPTTGDTRYTRLRQEIAQTTRKAIAELPLEQSEAVVMRYISKRGLGDIAESLGVSKTRAQRRLCQAVETLKRKVGSRSPSAA
ncbi:RNA polymerase sigma factor [Planctomycetota bacterium]